MDEHVDEMTRDIVRLVKIPSISDPDSDIKPFGPGCRAALEEMLKIGNEYGFKTKNYENYVGALWLDDGSPENTVGMWNHCLLYTSVSREKLPALHSPVF